MQWTQSVGHAEFDTKRGTRRILDTSVGHAHERGTRRIFKAWDAKAWDTPPKRGTHQSVGHAEFLRKPTPKSSLSNMPAKIYPTPNPDLSECNRPVTPASAQHDHRQTEPHAAGRSRHFLNRRALCAARFFVASIPTPIKTMTIARLGWNSAFCC